MFFRKRRCYDMLVEMKWPEDKKPSLRAFMQIAARDLPDAVAKATRECTKGVEAGWKCVSVRHVDRTEMLHAITAAQPFPSRTWPWRAEDDNDETALAERELRRRERLAQEPQA